MIYKNYKDSKLTDVLVMCDCGCSGLNFKLFGDVVFISTYSDSFYTYQKPSRFNRKALFRKVFKKENVINDIILPTEEVDELINALECFEFSPDDGDTYENSSHLKLSPITIDNDLLEYELLLVYDGNLMSILRNKTYRGFEVALKEKEFTEFVNKLKSDRKLRAK